MKRSGIPYTLLASRELRGGIVQTQVRLQAVAGLWSLQIGRVMAGWSVVLYNAAGQEDFRALASSEEKARGAFDAYMRDVAMPHGVTVTLRGMKRPVNACPYCHDGMPRGMACCRKASCLTRAQIDIATRGSVR
jgi:hypothetical protein